MSLVVCDRIALRRWAVPSTAIAIGAVAPDMDIVLMPFGSFNALHRVVTHNVFFVAAVALVVAAGTLVVHRTQGGARVPWFTSASASVRALLGALVAGSLHLVVDAIMDNNPSNGMGIAWLWPLHEGFLHPFNIVPLANNPEGWDAPLRQLMTLLPGLAWEAPFVILALLLYRAPLTALLVHLRRR